MEGDIADFLQKLQEGIKKREGETKICLGYYSGYIPIVLDAEGVYLRVPIVIDAERKYARINYKKKYISPEEIKIYEGVIKEAMDISSKQKRALYHLSKQLNLENFLNVRNNE